MTIVAPVALGVGDPCNAIDSGAALAPSSSTTCVHSFTASGSWTVPVGVTSVDVLAVGGGGGGGVRIGNRTSTSVPGAVAVAVR